MFKVKDISFVIITRNESFGIRKSLSALKKIPMSNCEIICVDSDSSDDTLDVINEESSSFDSISVYQCKGYLNAAVGRYIGFENASKPFVFFMDGDIELNPIFIKRALNVFQEYQDVVAVTGGLDEVIYNRDFSNVQKKHIRVSFKEEKSVYHSGGCIIARNTAVKECGSWDIKLKSSEDRDFVARLWSVGRVVAITEQIGVHHTRPYSDTFWLKLNSRHYCCLGILLSKHFWNLNQWRSIMKVDPAPFFGFFIYSLIIISTILFYALDVNFWLVFSLPICFFGIDIVLGVLKWQNLVYRFFNRYIRPGYILIGFLFGFKADIKNVMTKKIL